MNIAGAINTAWDALTQSTYFIEDPNIKVDKNILDDIQDFSRTFYTGGFIDNKKSKVVLQLDMIEEVNFRATSNVTQYPTESGINAVDYKYDNPSTLSVHGYIHRNSVLGQAILTLFDKATAVKKIDEELAYYKSGLYLLNIKTKNGLRKGYTLQDYELPETYDNYSLLEVDMTFKQVPTPETSNVLPSASDTVQCGIMRLLGLN